MNTILILTGKLISWVSKTLNRGNGSTWPGHIALSVNHNFIRDVLKENQPNVIASEAKQSQPQGIAASPSAPRNDEREGLQIILVAGTNGKTTTSLMIKDILQKADKKVMHNASGANLLNGLASALIQYSNLVGNIDADFLIFETDENTLPLVLKEVTPQYIVLLNLFRDQLDRYGEVNTIALKWNYAMQNLPPTTTLILNADDPQIAYLGLPTVILANEVSPESVQKDPGHLPALLRKALLAGARMTNPKVLYFGLNDKKYAQKTPQHAVDSIYCPRCNTKLDYSLTYFSHLGIWKCLNCRLSHPKVTGDDSPVYPLDGVYNRYNTNAAVLLSRTLNINEETINSALHEFAPAFGRQEIINVDGKKVRLFLSKNPTSFNQSLRTMKEMGAKTVLIVLNDRIPDGRDVSWIWDVDFEEYLDKSIHVHVSGDRCWDMTVRLKYAYPAVNHINTHERLDYAIRDLIKDIPKNETLYILPTYSAMLQVRKYLTGKKIL